MKPPSLFCRVAAAPCLAAFLLVAGIVASNPSYGQGAGFSGVASGSWVNPVGGPTLVTTIVNGATSTFRHGNTFLDLGNGLVLDVGVANVLTFTQTPFSNVSPETSFQVGELTMTNGTTFGDSEASSVKLRISLAFSGSTRPIVIDLPLELISTANSSDRLASADIVRMTTSAPIFYAPDGLRYRMQCYWVSMDAAAAVIAGSPSNEADVYEGSTATIELRASLQLIDPVIVTQPVGSNGTFGSVGSLSVTTNAAYGYQWYRGESGDTSSPVVGGTGASLQFTRTVSGLYWVRAFNDYGSADSHAALVTVDQPALTALTLTIGWVAPSFRVTGVANTGVTYEWFRNGMPVPHATGQELSFDQRREADAGFYTARVTAGNTSVMTNAVPLNYAMPVQAGVTVLEGLQAVFSIVAAGPDLSFQWMNGDSPLPENGHFVGTQTRELRINRVSTADIGFYICRVSNGVDVQQLAFELNVRGRPTVQILGYPSTYEHRWTVGVPIAESVGTQVQGNRLVISVSGLPPGMKFDTYSGIIDGTPTRAGTYTIRMQGRNEYGLGPVATAKVIVDPEPDRFTGNLVGTFYGLVDHDAAINEGLGGRFTLTTTPNGRFSGVVTTGGVTRRFVGTMARPDTYSDPTSELILAVSRGVPTLSLSFSVGPDLVVTGMLQSPTSHASIRAVRSPWVGDIRAAHYAGVHIAALPPYAGLEGDNTFPQGTGYIVGGISLSGVFTAGARFADNTVATIATVVCQDRSIPFHYPLYGGIGSAQGWATSDGQTMDGDLIWTKQPQSFRSTTRSYKNGFPAHLLSIVGSRRHIYSGNEILMGLPDQPNNARFTLSLMGDAGDVSQSFRVTNRNAALMPTGSPLSLTLIRDQSKFIGTVSYQGRSGPCYGMFIDRLGYGVGHFQLPESTARNAPLLSRKIVVAPGLQ